MKPYLKILIGGTIALSLACIAIPKLLTFLALSSLGVKKWYLWQLISYPLVQRGGISLPFFIELGFNMYLLWIFGSSLEERLGSFRLLCLYFGAALAGGVSALFFPTFFLAGATNPIYALLIAWVIANPGSKLLFFFAIPFKAEWLIFGIIGFTLFLNLSAGMWVEATSIGASAIFGYLFALFSFKKVWRAKKALQTPRHKIFDIKSGAPILNDEQFMDAMLEKISQKGEAALTDEERARMQEISNKKRK